MSSTVLPDPTTEFGRRVRRRLDHESLVWLTTTGADGTPQPNPVWFLWDEPDTVLVYNHVRAHRLTHLAERPRVSLHFDTDGSGGDVVVLAGTAERAPEIEGPDQHPGYRAKYAEGMARVSGDAATFAATYAAAIRIRIDRVRGF